MTASPIFKDTALNAELAEQGYVITTFLQPLAIRGLIEASDQYIPADVGHFFATTHSPDLALRKQANEVIQCNIAVACNEHFDQAQPLGGAFIAKPPHGKGVLSLHQDWNIVDEHQHRSFNIWIPLVDTHAENGAVHVLPGSHNKEFTIRGPRIGDGWNGLEKDIYQHLKRLDMKAGEALVYDHALWHSSPPNQSTEPRPAVVIGMVAKDTPLKAYFGEDGQVAEYELTPSYFFEELDITTPTILKKLRTFAHQNPALTQKKMEGLYLEQAPKSWWKKMLQRI